MDAIHILTGGNPGNLIPLIALAGSFLVAIVGIIAGTMSTVARAKAREESRREIAAYIAEGSMSPAEGERLLAAGKKKA